MVITEGGILIRTSSKEVSVVGRNTQGVKIIRIKENEKVSSIAVVKSESLEEETSSNEVLTEESSSKVDNEENK